MKLELYHRWECPYSAKVRNFIDQHNLQGQIKFIELDEMPGAEERLLKLNMKSQTPCLLVDGEPILESKDIINWLDENLVSRDQASL